MRRLLIFFLCIVSFFWSVYGQTIPTNGLVAWYPFNGNANDLSGNNLDGVINGATSTTDRFGNPGSAFLFNGISDFIQVDNDSLINFDVNDDFTISVWILAQMPITINPTMDIIAKWEDYPGGNNENYPFTIRIKTAFPNNIQMMRYDKNCSNFPITESDFSAPVVENEWHNLTFVKSGDSLIMYFDGAETSYRNDFTSCGTMNSHPLYIGKRGGTINNAHFHGKIDDLAIYNRALGQCEINDLLGFDINSRLKVYYPFNASANDESGNNQNGQVSGATLSTDAYGKSLSAYSFDGNDDYIYVGDVMDVNSEHGMTFSAWFYPEQIGGVDNRFVGFQIGTKESGEIGLRIRTENDLRISTHFNGGRSTPNAFNGTEAISQVYSYNSWNHITGTFRDGRTDLYVNGEFVDSNTQLFGTGGRFSFFQAFAELNIGKAYSDNDQEKYFHGKLDEIRIYNRILSDCEIKELIECNPEFGLLTNFEFDGNALDNSGNSNNGTTVNITATTNRFGNSNSALDFNGAAYVDANDDYDLPVISFNFWFLAREIQPSISGVIYDSDHPGLQNGTNKIRVITSAGQDVLRMSSGGSNALLEIPVCKENWYMGTMTRDSKEVKFYLNGELKGVRPYIQGGPSVDGSTTAIIGADRLFNRHLDGIIDDFRIYNRVLRDCEILELFDNYTNQSGNYLRNQLCANDTIILQSGRSNVSWYIMDSLLGIGSDIEFTTDRSSILLAKSLGDCNNLIIDTFELEIPAKPEYTLGDTVMICPGAFDTIPFSTGSNTNVVWSDGNRFVNPNSNLPILRPISLQDLLSGDLRVYASLYRDNFLCEFRDSVLIIPDTGNDCFENSLNIIIPNIVTNNDDGYNDNFFIRNISLFPNSRLEIYNRFGRLVYNNDNYNNEWPDRKLPAGVYYFQLSISEPLNKVYKGYLHLMN